MAEPNFTPKPGQVDYSDIRYSPVVNCVVRLGDYVLLQQRSPEMRLYPSYWNGISGFLDTNGSVEEKALEELSEEAGITKHQVQSLVRGQVLIQEAPEYHKTWIVFPVLATLKSKIKPQLNWEATSLEWVKKDQLAAYNLLPGFAEVLQTFSLHL